MTPTQTFDIHDEEGYTGCEAETLPEAKRACEQIATEGYDVPLEIRLGDRRICTMTALDESGHGVWRTSTLTINEARTAARRR